MSGINSNMSVPMISPENADHRRGGHIIRNDVQRIQKHGKSNKVVEKERSKTNNNNNSATMIKERQIAMVVSPENNNNYNTKTAGVVRGTETQSDMITTLNLPPTMISPPMATPSTTKQKQSALISGESSTTSIKQHNVYQTPRKIKSPPTGVTPFLLSSTSQKHKNIQKIISSNNYSPLTPNTEQYISNNSPFKSSSQILDDKLYSIMKMENSLEDKINNYEDEEDEDGEGQCCVDYSEEGGMVLYNTSSTNNVAVNNGECNKNNTSPEENYTNDSVGITNNTEVQLAFHTPNEEEDSQAIGRQTTAGTMYHTAKDRLAPSSGMNNDEVGSSSSGGSTDNRYKNLHHLRGNSKEGKPGAVVTQSSMNDTSFDSATTASTSSNIKLRRVLWRGDTVGRGEEGNIANCDDDDQSEKENSHTMLSNETFKRIEASKLKEGKQQPPSPTTIKRTTKGIMCANEGNEVVQSTEVQDASPPLQDHQLDTSLERIQASEMKNQLNELLHDRESLIAQRDFSTKQSKRYNSESKTLAEEVKTLESGMQNALQLVQDVQKVTVPKEEEVNELRKLLLNRDSKVEELQSLLTLKEEEVKELSSTAKMNEEKWNKKLDATEQQHKEDLERLTVQLRQTHSEEMERTNFQSQGDQMNTLQQTEIEAHSSSVSQRVAKASSSYSVNSVHHQEEIEHACTVSKDYTVLDVEGSGDKHENVDISSDFESLSYIGHEEGFRFFSSIDKSDISETSSERDSDVVNESTEILPAAASLEESATQQSPSENVQADVSTKLPSFSLSVIESVRNNTDKQREEEIDRITREYSDEIERLKSELATAKSTADKLMSEHENLQSDYASAVKENTDKVNALQMKIEEMVADFENERSELILALEKERQEKEGLTLVSAELRELESQATKSMFMKEQEHNIVVTELRELDAKNSRLVKDYEEKTRQLEANLESSTLELGTTLKQRDDLLSSQQDLQCKIYDMESEYNSLAEQFSTLQVEYQDVAKTIVDKDQVLVSKEDEVVSLTEKLVLFETELSDTPKKLTCIHEEKAEAKEQLLQAYHREEELNTLTKKLMSEKTSLKESVESMCSKYESSVAELNSHIEHSKSQNVVQIDKQLSIENQLVTVTKERDMLSSEVKRLEDQLRASTAESESRMLSLDEARSAKVDEIKQLQAKIKISTEMVTDLQQQNENLMNKNECILSDLKSKESLIERVQSDNEAIKGIEASLQAEKEAAFKLKSKFEQTEDILLNLQASKLFVETRLEEVLQDKSHLSTEVESMHDTIATLEASKERLTASLQDYQEKTNQLSIQVTALENQAKSNDVLVLNLEGHLSLKVNEVCSLHKTVNSHEETLVELRDQLQSLGMQKAQVEENLSSLHSKMDHVISERDGLAHQLDEAVKELESVREERNSLAAKVTDNHRIHHHHDEVHCHIFETAAATKDVNIVDSELGIRSNEQTYFDVLPGQGIREILNSSRITEREVDLVCEKMSNVRFIMTQIDQERKQLKKEAKQLRADLELAQGELTTANKEHKKIQRQTLSLRGVISQAKTLLEKAEEEKKQMALDLESTQKAMNHLIQQNSSQSYNAIVAQSEDEINKLKQELQKEKNESMRLFVATRKKAVAATIDDADYHHKPNKKISQYDVSYEANHNLNASSPPKVTSKERFKVEKGHSMFDMLKDIKKSGRRGVKYRT